MEGGGPNPSKEKEDEKKKRRLPSPRELISHYESQGMETQEASLKVIEDLQNVLFRMITSGSGSGRGGANNNKSSSMEITKKLDVINSRLVKVDMKLDSKPGYPQTLAIGVASGALLRGIGSVFPHVASAFAHLWNSVRTSTPPS